MRAAALKSCGIAPVSGGQGASIDRDPFLFFRTMPSSPTIHQSPSPADLALLRSVWPRQGGRGKAPFSRSTGLPPTVTAQVPCPPSAGSRSRCRTRCCPGAGHVFLLDATCPAASQAPEGRCLPRCVQSCGATACSVAAVSPRKVAVIVGMRRRWSTARTHAESAQCRASTVPPASRQTSWLQERMDCGGGVGLGLRLAAPGWPGWLSGVTRPCHLCSVLERKVTGAGTWTLQPTGPQAQQGFPPCAQRPQPHARGPCDCRRSRPRARPASAHEVGPPPATPDSDPAYRG